MQLKLGVCTTSRELITKIVITMYIMNKKAFLKWLISWYHLFLLKWLAHPRHVCRVQRNSELAKFIVKGSNHFSKNDPRALLFFCLLGLFQGIRICTIARQPKIITIRFPYISCSYSFLTNFIIAFHYICF